MSQLGTFNFFAVESITGDVGGPVYSLSGNINLVGDGTIIVSGNPALYTLTISNAGSVATSYNTDIGGPAVPAGHVLNVLGGNNITTTGAGNTITIDLTGTTNHAVQIGNATGSLTSLAVGATGETIMGTTGADPSWTNSPSFGGSVTAQTNITSTAGNVVITAGNLTLPNTNAAGTQGVISFGGTKWITNFGTHNSFVGAGSGNLALTVGTTTDNTAVGFNTMIAIDGALNNVAFGATSLTALTSGDNNCAYGSGSLSALTTGSDCIALGKDAGSAATVASSSDIYIGNIGAAESNTIRIGTQGGGAGQQNKSYMAGIYGASSAAATTSIVTVDSVGKLGAAALATNGQLYIGSTGAAPAWANLTTNDGIITVTNGAGTIDLGSVSTQRLNMTGFYSWAAGGPYFDDATLGTFKLLVGGTGYIHGKAITWVAQNFVGMTSGSTWYIYIDNTGTIGATNARTDALYLDNIVLFECLYDETPVTKLQHTVKDNHPYDHQADVSNYEHDVIGTVIENKNNGANITLVGPANVKIAITGADELEDHGLKTTIPDSGGVGVTWTRMYTTAGGKWATQNSTDTFTGFYNNAGTPTAIPANRFGVYVLYVSKDNLNSATPTYYAVLNTAIYTTSVAANNAITNGTVSVATNELSSLEFAQLGYIIWSGASANITSVIIAKSTLRQTISGGAGTNIAALVTTNTAAFNGILSAADTNVQAALDTIDDWGAGTTDHALLVGNGNGVPIGVLAVGTTGTILTGVTGNDPTWTTATYPSTVTQGDLLCATAANVIGVVAGSTAGYVLTANGASTAPTYQLPASLVWTVETADMAAVANRAYIANKAGTLTFTLPASCAVGKTFRFTGINTATGWKIAQNAGQTIYFGTSATTTGAGGYLQSSAIRDAVELVCVVANNDFNVVSSIGNITVV